MPLLLRFEPKVSTHADMECPGSLDSGHAHFLRHLGSRWSIRRNDYGKDHIAVQFLRFTGKAMKSQVGDEGPLFGSVTAPMIADAIAAEGIEIDKRRIDLAKPIKVVGEYPVNVALYRDIKATVNVAVIDQKTVEEAPAAEAEAEEAQVEAMVEEAVAEVEAAVEEIVAEVQAETAE